MKLLVLAMLLAGCGDNSAAVPPVDAGSDACVAAQGNCGCIVVLDYNSATGVSTSTVVCP